MHLRAVLSANYKVIIWDRRNSGASDFAIDDKPSEFDCYVEDLHSLLQELDLVPAYIAGGSGGMLTSIYMAHCYPDDVKGLVLLPPGSDNFELWRGLVVGWYYDLADSAETGGMEAALHHSANPDDNDDPGRQMGARWLAELATKRQETKTAYYLPIPLFSHLL